MEYMDVLQYFNENASKEEWDVVQKVYARELEKDLKDLGMEGKESFNLAELMVIYTRCALERDLEHVETIDHEFGASLESTKGMYMDIMTDILKEYKEEEENG